MTETLLQFPSQEIPQNLQFERFDDYGSGIVTLDDGRCVVEVGERPSRLKGSEGSVQRADLAFAIKFIEQEPDIAAWYGYQHIPPTEGGLARIVIPSPESLNERKNSLPPEIGVNQGTFKIQEGAIFGPIEYLSMLGEGEIPIATDPDEKAHDLCGHSGGFAVMSAELFNFLSATAREALSRDDFYAEEHRGDVTGMIDRVSGGLTERTSEILRSQISMVHTLNIPKHEMRELLDYLQASQQRTIEAFRGYARAQNELAGL